MGISAIIGGGLGLAGSILGKPDTPAPAQSGVGALPPWLQAQLEQGGGRVEDLYQQGPQSFFPGQTFAGLDPNQQAGLQSQIGAAGTQQSLLGQVNPAFGTALNAGNIFQDPSVMAGLNTIESRANQNFLESTLPGLRRGATGAGQEFGTRGELAAGVAGSRLGRDIGDAQSQFLAQQLASARGLQGQALGNTSGLLGAQQIPGLTQFGAGSIYQDQAQQGINEAMSRFNFEQQAPAQTLDDYLARLAQIGGSGGGNSIQPAAQPPFTNPISGALGGAMLGQQIAPLFGTQPSTGGYTNPAPFGTGAYQFNPFG